MNNDLISREGLREDLRRFFTIEALEGIEPKTLFAQIMHDIDNAPTVDLWEMRQEATENALKKAEVLYKRPQGEVTDCENCQFKKFSEDLADKLAKVMVDNGITDFDEFAKACGVSFLHQDSITKSDTQI